MTHPPPIRNCLELEVKQHILIVMKVKRIKLELRFDRLCVLHRLEKQISFNFIFIFIIPSATQPQNFNSSYYYKPTDTTTKVDKLLNDKEPYQVASAAV